MEAMSKILEGLNSKQQEAVLATEGPVLILAGAGSGKTKTLVHRIAYLVCEKNIEPEHILAVTFTNKAAREMKGRIHRMLQFLIPGFSRMPFVGTFHAFCVQVLRREIGVLGYRSTFTIYDAHDQQSLVKECMWHLGIDTKQFSPSLIHALISHAKNELILPAEFHKSADSPVQRAAADVYREYQPRLKEHNALDFDDLILKTVELLSRHRDIRECYQKQFTYLHIDEYQDTNHAQYQLVSLLAGKHPNLCVVGDDYQSIYSWRGADMQNILDFEKDYPKTRVIKLEQNYRSTKTIVAAGNAVIAPNVRQKKKTLWTKNADGSHIAIVETQNERDEASWVVKRVLGETPEVSQTRGADGREYVEDEQALSALDYILKTRHGFRTLKEKMQEEHSRNRIRASNISFSHHAVLYRTNAQSRAIEEALLQRGVPYQIVGGLKFYDRKEIKDMLAYAQSLANPDDATSIKRIVNVPARSIGEKTWERLYQYARSKKMPILDAALHAEKIPELSSRGALATREFGEQMEALQLKIAALSPSQSLDLIARSTGYKEAVLDGTDEGESRWENIQELKTVARKFDNVRGVEGLQQLLEEVALMSDIDTMKDDRNAVTLMTIHAAKGLEFPHVYVVGLEEGMFPHARSLVEDREMEEERRLAYVAMTRAKQTLVLTYAVERTVFGSTQQHLPSRFLDDLPEDLVEYIASPGEPF